MSSGFKFNQHRFFLGNRQDDRDSNQKYRNKRIVSKNKLYLYIYI